MKNWNQLIEPALLPKGAGYRDCVSLGEGVLGDGRGTRLRISSAFIHENITIFPNTGSSKLLYKR